MTEMTLAATPRTGTGKSVTRKLRRAGQVPAVVYGLGEPRNLQCNAHEAGKLVHLLHGSSRLISLEIAGDTGGQPEKKAVLLMEVQQTVVGGKLIHLDFQEVDVSQTVQVAVEVHPTGSPAGVKFGGILQQTTHEVTIECLPTVIPDNLTIDVSALEIGHSLHVSDLMLGEGLTLVTDPEETLFVVAAPRAEEEEAAEEEEGLVEGEAAAEGESAEGEAEESGEE